MHGSRSLSVIQYKVNQAENFPLLVEVGFLVGLVQVGEGGKGFFDHGFQVDGSWAQTSRFYHPCFQRQELFIGEMYRQVAY